MQFQNLLDNNFIINNTKNFTNDEIDIEDEKEIKQFEKIINYVNKYNNLDNLDNLETNNLDNLDNEKYDLINNLEIEDKSNNLEIEDKSNNLDNEIIQNITCNEMFDKEDRHKQFLYNINLVNNIEDTVIKNKILFNICLGYIEIFNLEEFRKLKIIILNQLIKMIKLGHEDLIKTGNLLFKNFNDYLIQNSIIINDKNIDNELDENSKNLLKSSYLNYTINKMENSILYAKKIKPKYKENQIIGAKDKNNKWWMSTVKKIFMINKKIVYLIHFNGWGDEFNEFIEEGIRLTYYNHYKHKQFQSKKINDIINLDI